MFGSDCNLHVLRISARPQKIPKWRVGIVRRKEEKRELGQNAVDLFLELLSEASSENSAPG
jgi:hypothetical protein